MTEETNLTEHETPSKEEYLAYMDENIELHKKRAELQKIQTQIAIDRADELKALMFIAQVTQVKPEAEDVAEDKKERKLSRKSVETEK